LAVLRVSFSLLHLFESCLIYPFLHVLFKFNDDQLSELITHRALDTATLRQLRTWKDPLIDPRLQKREKFMNLYSAVYPSLGDLKKLQRTKDFDKEKEPLVLGFNVRYPMV
jgi:hypothetical protein